MKIVYFGNNLFSSCLKYLLDENHQILRVYKNSHAHESSIMDRLCEKNDIAIYEHRPKLIELNDLISLGAELFIVAEYAYLVPDTNVKYAINIHPSLLPEGRGPTPLPYLIKNPDFSGVTIHKITNNFDSGDVILQAKVLQSTSKSITTLMIKMHLESVKLLKLFIENINNYYESAKAQVNYSYWSKIEMSESVLDWNTSINEIKIQKLCFGHLGLIIKLDQVLWVASHLEFINEKQTPRPGCVVFEDDSLLAVTALDGIVCIHKRSMFSLPV